MKHTDTAATLAAIDATLRLTDKQLWEDPEFQEWEAGQVDDDAHTRSDGETVTTLYRPGPEHWINHPDSREAGLLISDTVRSSPMVDLAGDHRCRCDQDTEPSITWHNSMRITAAAYPAPEHTTLGPLMLGPEPGTRADVLTSLSPGRRYRDAEGATWERTDDGMQLLTDTDGKDFSTHIGCHLWLPEEAEDVLAFAPYTPA